MCDERKTNKSAHPHNHFPIRFFWRREIIEKHKSSRPIEHKKRTCETWQLKLSSGGGTYGIHPPVVVVFFVVKEFFCPPPPSVVGVGVGVEQHRSFRPKNILVLSLLLIMECVKSILHRSEESRLFAESVMYVSRVFFTKC